MNEEKHASPLRGKAGTLRKDKTSRWGELAAEWHPSRNGVITLRSVPQRTKVWWLCGRNSSHEYESRISDRLNQGQGCPYCARVALSPERSLAVVSPVLAGEWHPTKNGNKGPGETAAKSSKRAWWLCRAGHEWEAAICSRSQGNGCPYCRGYLLSTERSLAVAYPAMAREWHPTLNGTTTPRMVSGRGDRLVWWTCSEGHAWKSTVGNRTRGGQGCPVCNRGWSVETLRNFIASIRQHLPAMEPHELYLICQQQGLLSIQGKGRGLAKALASGQLPLAELDRFIAGQESGIDRFIDDQTQAVAGDDEIGAPDDGRGPAGTEDAPRLPLVSTSDILSAAAATLRSNKDEEAAEFLIASFADRLWKRAFQDESEVLAGLVAQDEFSLRVSSRFFEEYRKVKDLKIPAGYAFKPPNLMQRLIAVRIRDRKALGNWSGTGAGKTLSAVLASRIIGAKLTVICCPNATVDGWREKILEYFPKSTVACKTWAPKWPRGPARHYLVLNYEMFQQDDSAARVAALARQGVDFVILDEVHFAKTREDAAPSQRRYNVQDLLARAAEKNDDLHVMAMSATPVINDLSEGKSLIELVTQQPVDLETRATVPNCMALHRQMVMLGIRYMPNYQAEFEQKTIDVDCSEFLDEIRALNGKGSPLQLEQILTRARLPIIRQNVRPKTLIYTHLVGGIAQQLAEAIRADGWSVGFYTGEDKDGLDAFIKGDLDVLIGSSAVSTGVDHLQDVCSHLIINVLPWTHSEYEQLKGRLYRQGQEHKVTAIVPLTFADVLGRRWSWCESKMERLKFKKSIADSAVDGVVPEGHIRTPEQAYQDLMAWLRRLDEQAA